jgi:hypothetical protein
MPATRQLVTLHPSHNLRVLATMLTNLDVNDSAMLRDVLERMVMAKMGTLHLDLSHYRIRVRDISRGGAPSTVRCWCEVTTAGRTAVRR